LWPRAIALQRCWREGTCCTRFQALRKQAQGQVGHVDKVARMGGCVCVCGGGGGVFKQKPGNPKLGTMLNLLLACLAAGMSRCWHAVPTYQCCSLSVGGRNVLADLCGMCSQTWQVLRSCICVLYTRTDFCGALELMDAPIWDCRRMHVLLNCRSRQGAKGRAQDKQGGCEHKEGQGAWGDGPGQHAITAGGSGGLDRILRRDCNVSREGSWGSLHRSNSPGRNAMENH
jgi:hypothetical protein